MQILKEGTEKGFRDRVTQEQEGTTPSSSLVLLGTRTTLKEASTQGLASPATPNSAKAQVARGRVASPRYFYSSKDNTGKWNYESSGFYDQRTMDKMFEEFMKRAREEENRRKQTYYSQQRQNAKHQNEAYRGPGRDGEAYGGYDPFGEFFKSSSDPTYQRDYEKAKAEERRQRAEEYDRMQRESEERARRAMKEWQETAAKAADSFELGKQVAEKEGIVKGVITGFKSFFKK